MRVNDDEATIDVGENPIRWCTGYPTDEGSHWEGNEWWLEDGKLRCSYTSHDVDCDGPLSYYSDLCADPSSIEDGWPVWERMSSWQRDVYAEQMGY